MSETTVTFRVDKTLKKRFSERVRESDRPASQVLRDFMRSFVQEPGEAPGYDDWFREQVEMARNDPRRPLASATVERRLAMMRESARAGTRHRKRASTRRR